LLPIAFSDEALEEWIFLANDEKGVQMFVIYTSDIAGWTHRKSVSCGLWGVQL
jgi:hypothetical protein